MNALRDALEDIDNANRLGWGAFVAIGLRRPGLNRWQRGRAEDVVALPAVFVDIDDPSVDTLTRLYQFNPQPSCIVHSGGGFHAYWWLEQPSTDLNQARRVLRALSVALAGDPMSVAQCLRLVGSINTKSARQGAQCRLVHLDERRYAFDDFAALIPCIDKRSASGQVPAVLSSDLVSRVVDAFALQGYVRRGDWLNGPCPYAGRHKHGDRHPSFGFNTRTGYGYCHLCGSMLLKDLCEILSVPTPTTYLEKQRSDPCQRLSG